MPRVGLGERLFQIRQPTGAATDGQTAVAVEHGQTGGVVTSVFHPPQGVDHDIAGGDGGRRTPRFHTWSPSLVQPGARAVRLRSGHGPHPDAVQHVDAARTASGPARGPGIRRYSRGGLHPGVRFPPAGIAFGHDWLTDADNYTGTLEHLASWGIVAAAPDTQRGPVPRCSTSPTTSRHLGRDFGVRLGQGQISVSPEAPALAGHGFGAAAAVLAAGAAHVRAVAAVFLSVTKPPPKRQQPLLTVPGLVMATRTTPVAAHRRSRGGRGLGRCGAAGGEEGRGRGPDREASSHPPAGIARFQPVMGRRRRFARC